MVGAEQSGGGEVWGRIGGKAVMVRVCMERSSSRVNLLSIAIFAGEPTGFAAPVASNFLYVWSSLDACIWVCGAAIGDHAMRGYADVGCTDGK